MEKYNLKNKTDIKMHNVLFATTSERDYEMERLREQSQLFQSHDLFPLETCFEMQGERIGTLLT